MAAGDAPARCIALGANGVITPGSPQDYASCRAFLLDTATLWVRLWADWPSLQPEPRLAPDAGSGAWRLQQLDRQIAQARADGISVILTSYRFPAWANGTAGLVPPADMLYAREDRAPRTGRVGAAKDLRFRLPSDLGPGSAWAGWIEFLLRRYDGAIAALELVNEPNSQVWPLQGPSVTGDRYGVGPVTVHRAVAQMFATAQALAATYRSRPLLLGPATSDGPGRSRLALAWDEFTRLLLDELGRIGFRAGPQFAWSQHNYTDVERAGSATTTARALLAGRWAGAPDLYITEGGARLTRIAQLYRTAGPAQLRTLQSQLIARNLERTAREPGIAMVSQYLFYSDPNFDSGLLEVDGARRPAYDVWAAAGRA